MLMQKSTKNTCNISELDHELVSPFGVLINVQTVFRDECLLYLRSFKHVLIFIKHCNEQKYELLYITDVFMKVSVAIAVVKCGAPNSKSYIPSDFWEISFKLSGGQRAS